MKTKRCSGCKVEKSLDCFSNNKNMRDGKNYYCKDCRSNKYNYYKKNNDNILIFPKKDIELLYKITLEYLDNLKNDSDVINNIEKVYDVMNIKKRIEDYQKNN
jgi:hypothetical protein